MEPLAGAPYKAGWWSFDLGRYRPCDGTYELYDYDSLPPLAELDESLAFLSATSDETNADRGAVDTLATQARLLGLTLPPSFTRLMSSPTLQERIPSCTACEFDLGEELTPSPGADGYTVRFLRDQQDCVLWYLYLSPSGGQRVLAFPGDLDEYVAEVGASDSTYTLGDVSAGIRICAPTFASFIYRFWLENTLWFKLGSADATPFTPTEQAYLDFYERQRASQN